MSNITKYMDKARSKRPRDFDQFAAVISKTATEGEVLPVERPKNHHAVSLAKLVSSKGGKARAGKLSAKRWSVIARKASASRWKKLTG